MIEGTLKYLGKRKSYIVSIFDHFIIFAVSLRHPQESFIHVVDIEKVDLSFITETLFEVLALETKYYFALDTESGEANPVYTFTEVHKHIVAGQADNAGYMSPTRFGGHTIKIHTFSIKEHTHYGRYPEIYPGEYEVGG